MGWSAIHRTRNALNRILSRVQFAIDTYPRKNAYQPLPWLAIDGARRAVGSQKRWEAIWAEVQRHNPAGAMDIGCNIGFFSIHLARKGITTLGLESNARFFRTAAHAKRQLNCHNLNLQLGEISPATIHLLPRVDVCLCLSVWHHWVRHWGLDAANRILEGIWDRTGQVLFFDTGQSEMPKLYRLPEMVPDPQTWLINYLGSIVGPRNEVTCLGSFPAFEPGKREEDGIVERCLFVARRAFG